jgi:hypothetical protein
MDFVGRDRRSHRRSGGGDLVPLIAEIPEYPILLSLSALCQNARNF